VENLLISSHDLITSINSSSLASHSSSSYLTNGAFNDPAQDVSSGAENERGSPIQTPNLSPKPSPRFSSKKDHKDKSYKDEKDHKDHSIKSSSDTTGHSQKETVISCKLNDHQVQVYCLYNIFLQLTIVNHKIICLKNFKLFFFFFLYI
jgi:hypothetical protein